MDEAIVTVTTPNSTAEAIENDQSSSSSRPSAAEDFPIKMLFSWQQIILIIFFTSLIFITVVGNTLIIIAVLNTKRLRTVTNCFIMSLAVADWLVGAFVMPLAVVSHVIGSWEFGRLLCDVWISSDVCLCTASILSLCAISIDRYLAITQPLNYSRRLRSKRLASVMILIVWLLAIMITCPPIFSWYDRRASNTCTYNQNPYYVVFSAMGSFYVPLAVMLYVYAKISRVVAYRHSTLRIINDVNEPKSQNKRPGEREDSDKFERISSESEEAKSRLSKKQDQPNCMEANSTVKISLKRESKTTQTLTIVVGGFIACWLPFFVAYLFNPFLTSGVPTVLMISLTWLGWMNSAINPFIYAFCSPDFRCALWRITVGCCLRKHRQQSSNGVSRIRTFKRTVSSRKSIPVTGAINLPFEHLPATKKANSISSS